MTSDEPQVTGCTETARGIVNAMVAQAIARCEREGIELEDFYKAMRSEQLHHPGESLPDLFDHVFRRLTADRN